MATNWSGKPGGFTCSGEKGHKSVFFGATKNQGSSCADFGLCQCDICFDELTSVCQLDFGNGHCTVVLFQGTQSRLAPPTTLPISRTNEARGYMSSPCQWTCPNPHMMLSTPPSDDLLFHREKIFVASDHKEFTFSQRWGQIGCLLWISWPLTMSLERSFKNKLALPLLGSGHREIYLWLHDLQWPWGIIFDPSPFCLLDTNQWISSHRQVLSRLRSANIVNTPSAHHCEYREIQPQYVQLVVGTHAEGIHELVLQ